MSHAHRLHHIDIDRYGVYICRECSTDRLYVLRQDEVARLLLMDRADTEQTITPSCVEHIRQMRKPSTKE